MATWSTLLHPWRIASTPDAELAAICDRRWSVCWASCILKRLPRYIIIAALLIDQDKTIQITTGIICTLHVGISRMFQARVVAIECGYCYVYRSGYYMYTLGCYVLQTSLHAHVSLFSSLVCELHLASSSGAHASSKQIRPPLKYLSTIENNLPIF
jgi:hypothetical protein